VGPSFGPSCITSIHIWEWHFWGSEASVPFLIIQFNQEFAPNIEPAFEAISNDFSSNPRGLRGPVLIEMLAGPSCISRMIPAM
jgi:hypothetical protein